MYIFMLSSMCDSREENVNITYRLITSAAGYADVWYKTVDI